MVAFFEDNVYDETNRKMVDALMNEDNEEPKMFNLKIIYILIKHSVLKIWPSFPSNPT